MNRLERGIKTFDAKFELNNFYTYDKNLERLAPEAVKQKNELSKKFELVDGNNLQNAIYGKTFYVTKKLDGIFTCCQLYVDDTAETVVVCKSSGNEITGLKCIEELKEIARKKYFAQNTFNKKLDISFLMELYMPGKERTRVSDVLHALSSEKKDELCLAPFYTFNASSYARDEFRIYKEVHQFMTEFFEGAKQITTVPMQIIEREENESDESLKQRVQDIYNKWVKEEGAEGLVIRNENDVIWKIKPRHTIDAVAIGFTRDHDGSLRDIMFAVMDKEGQYHRFACGITGIGYTDKISLLEYFKTKKVESSNFYYTNSVGIAYEMVEPEKIFEISCVDLATTKLNNEPCKNDLLIFDKQNGWQTKGQVNGASCHGLSVVRERDDKSCIYEQIRLEQLSQIMPFEEEKIVVDFSNLPKSEVIEKYVCVKQRGKQNYAKKFLIWKTNKEQTEMYPPFILYYEDFSSGREEHIKYDMFVANTLDDAKAQMTKLISKNVKGGWTYVYKENAK